MKMEVTVKFEAHTIYGLRTLLDQLDRVLIERQHKRRSRVLHEGEAWHGENACGNYCLEVRDVDK